MPDQPSEYGRSRSMDKRLKAMGKPGPDQPSKESLERAIKFKVHSDCYWDNACSRCIRLALEFDAIAAEAREKEVCRLAVETNRIIHIRLDSLRQQNAALVSALQNLMSKVSDELTGIPKNLPKFHWAAEWDAAEAALASYAPAETKEKP